MTLSPEQKQAVAAWVAAGDNLSAVQKKISEQFKLSLTYMDVRFLVDDLGLELRNASPKPDATDVTKVHSAPPVPAAEKRGFIDKLKEKVGMGASSADDEDELPAEEFADEEGSASPAPPPFPAASPAVKIDIDRITRPGSVVSGTVTFSDGVGGKWALDQYGRLMLDTGQAGYQPSAPDVQAFQRELSNQLQRHGL